MLGPLLANAGIEAHFWNAPSSLRPDEGAFEPEGAFHTAAASLARCIRACAEPPLVVTHSFGIHYALAALDGGVTIQRLVAVAPALPALEAFLGVLRLAHRDFVRRGSPVASGLEGHLRQATALGDEHVRQALAMALEDPDLLGHYWQSADARAAYVSWFSQPRWSFDVPAFFAEVADLAARPVAALPVKKRPVPTLVVFGANDPIIPVAASEAAVRAQLDPVETVTFDVAGHMPHLEWPDRFVQLLTR